MVLGYYDGYCLTTMDYCVGTFSLTGNAWAESVWIQSFVLKLIEGNSQGG